jgi:hypothetical protein
VEAGPLGEILLREPESFAHAPNVRAHNDTAQEGLPLRGRWLAMEAPSHAPMIAA